MHKTTRGERCAKRDGHPGRHQSVAARDRSRDQRVCKVYGLKPGAYDLIYAAQGGKCFICQRATGKTRRLAVDHNHKTGEVRGLLCKTCNRMLGHLRDDPLAFWRALIYLVSPPAREALNARG